jgi:hypothetical protein
MPDSQNMSNQTNSLHVETERNDASANERPIPPGVREKRTPAPGEQVTTSSLKRPYERSFAIEMVRWLTRSLAVLAVVSCIALVAIDATPLLTAWSSAIAQMSERGWAFIKTGPLSALPLLLAGSSYMVLQVILRPRPLELLKRLMLGCAFLLWGVTQLMAASNLATELGNVVIALYVVDLGLMIHSDLERDSLARS